jgi:aminoglycoside phosphotransferase
MKNLVRAICKKENLEAKTIQPLSGGQTNCVFLVDDKYIVRIGSGEIAHERLKHETKLIQAFEHEIPVPEICAFGQYGDSTYQIQQYVQGQRLHRIWNELSWHCKDKIVAELASCLSLPQRLC